MSHKFRESDMRCKGQRKVKSDFLEREMPDTPPTSYNKVSYPTAELTK